MPLCAQSATRLCALICCFCAIFAAPTLAQADESGWTPELRALHEASVAATEYAANNPGVGIVIHVGEDFPNEVFEEPQEYADFLIAAFDRDHQTPARAFYAPNPGTAGTGVTYHIRNTIHGANNGTEVKGVVTAFEAIADVVAEMNKTPKQRFLDSLDAKTDDEIRGIVSGVEEQLKN